GERRRRESEILDRARSRPELDDEVTRVAVAVERASRAGGGADGGFRAEEGGLATGDDNVLRGAEGVRRPRGGVEDFENDVVELAVGEEVARNIARIRAADEGVSACVRVHGHEVGGEAGEGGEATVGGNGSRETAVVTLGGARADAHALGGAGQPVVEEDVGASIPVPRHQVGGVAVEQNKAAVS